jgi:hypothetical protein
MMRASIWCVVVFFLLICVGVAMFGEPRALACEVAGGAYVRAVGVVFCVWG